MTDSRELTDPLCLPPARAAELLEGAPWRRFGVVGDSLSAGTGDETPGYGPAGWADRVAVALGPGLEYENRAVVGATSEHTLDGFEAWLTRFEPDLLHLPSAANDLLGREPDFAAIERRLATLYELAAGAGATLTAFTFGRAFDVPAFDDWGARILRVNDIVRRLALEHHVVLCDMWAHPVNDRRDLVSADRIHFATVGQAVMAAEVVKALAERVAARTGATA